MIFTITASFFIAYSFERVYSTKVMKPGKDYIGVGSGVVILNEQNELLLMLRSPKSRNEHGMWAIPGGKVEFNERIEDTIVREVQEEIGITLVRPQSVGYIDHMITSEKQHWVSIIFIAESYTGTVTNCEEDKCEELKWFALDAIPENASPVVHKALTLFHKSQWEHAIEEV